MTCNHGATLSDKRAVALEGFMDDLAIIYTDGISKKVEKKTKIRINKCLARYSKNQDEAKKTVMAEAYSAAARSLLRGETEVARAACQMAFRIMMYSCDGGAYSAVMPPPHELQATMEQVYTEQGIVLFVAKRIPCKCLDQRKKEVKKEPKLGVCSSCKKAAPASEQFQCGKCTIPKFCGKECQLEHWKVHKRDCSDWAAVYKKKAGDKGADHVAKEAMDEFLALDQQRRNETAKQYYNLPTV